jgi:hypothetical protein
MQAIQSYYSTLGTKMSKRLANLFASPWGIFTQFNSRHNSITNCTIINIGRHTMKTAEELLTVNKTWPEIPCADKHGRFFVLMCNHGLRQRQKTKCRMYWCLTEFIDWWVEIQLVMLVLRPSFVNYYPSKLFSDSPPPPLPSHSQSTVYTESVWLARGGGCRVVLETIFWRS